MDGVISLESACQANTHLAQSTPVVAKLEVGGDAALIRSDEGDVL